MVRSSAQRKAMFANMNKGKSRTAVVAPMPTVHINKGKTRTAIIANIPTVKVKKDKDFQIWKDFKRTKSGKPVFDKDGKFVRTSKIGQINSGKVVYVLPNQLKMKGLRFVTKKIKYRGQTYVRDPRY